MAQAIGVAEDGMGGRVEKEVVMSMDPAARRRLLVALAFAAVYVIWGSTYLAIRFAIETLPPLLMASARFLVAGALLYGWARARGGPAPSRREWRDAAIIGGLLLLGGNGLVVWSEQRVPSGLTALLVATVPIWVVLLDWLRPGGSRPARGVLLGIAVGIAGMILLVGPGEIAGGGGVDPLGAGALLIATLSWAAGSLFSRTARLPSQPLLATAMEMLAGGAMLAVVGLGAGELGRFAPQAVSLRSSLALLYLVVFGSIVAFSAYVWLLREVDTAKVSTYAYVNPVVALVLGWALADEALGARSLLAAVVILAAVVLITVQRSGPRRQRGPLSAGSAGTGSAASAAAPPTLHRPGESPDPSGRRRSWRARC